MTIDNNVLSLRLTKEQLSYLENISQQSSKSKSDLVRSIIQEKIKEKNAAQNSQVALAITIETNQLLKQLLRTYYDNSDALILAAKNTADDIFTTIGHNL